MRRVSVFGVGQGRCASSRIRIGGRSRIIRYFHHIPSMQCGFGGERYAAVCYKNQLAAKGEKGTSFNKPIDFRRASLCSRIICRSRSLCSCSSRSIAAAFPSRIAEEALKVSKGLTLPPDWRGGVSKSISNPSFPCPSPWPSAPLFRCDLRDGVCLRISSKEGMSRTGETGTVGLRIDLRGKEAVD